MPRREDYGTVNELDVRFREMSDEDFRAFAADPKMDETFEKYTQAEKTAFLNRAIMLDEKSEDFEHEVIVTKETNLVQDGPEDVKKAVQNHTGINDQYSSARDFHYDIYRTILYCDDEARGFATDITSNMSATNIVKNAPKLRQLLSGHLRLPSEANEDPEIKKQMTAAVAKERQEFGIELGTGVYRRKAAEKAPEEAVEDAPVDFSVYDPKGRFHVTVTALRKEQAPEALFDGFDAPQTTPQMKRNMLFSYILQGMSQKEATSCIKKIQAGEGLKGLQDLMDKAATVLSKEQLIAERERLTKIITGKDPNHSLAMSLNRKLDIVREQKGLLTDEEVKAKQRRYIGTDIYAADRERTRQRQEEEARKQKAKDDLKALADRYIEAGKDLAKDDKGYSWAVYAEKHRTEPGRNYTQKEKEVMLSKLLLASRVQQYNGMKADKPEEQARFNLSSARKEAEKLRNTPVFKGLVEQGLVDEYLKKTPAELAEAGLGMRKPFNSMSYAQRVGMLDKLKKMAAYVDPAEGRSEKWRRFKASVDSLKNCSILKSADPALNGESKFEEIFQNAVDYMKGKKSLRSNAESQRHFDQALDFMTELSKGTPYAKLAAEKVYNRINEVRRGHHQNADYVYEFSYVSEKIRDHSRKDLEPDQEAEREDSLVF